VIFRLLFKVYKGVVYRIFAPLYNRTVFHAHAVDVSSPWKINGFIYIENHNSSISIGKHLSVNSSFFYNNIGRQHSTALIAEKGGKLHIGNNVGISATTIVCHKEVEIQDNVRIGGNCVIYDTDFHSLNPVERTTFMEDTSLAKTAKVTIGKNVFIGAHTTILKGTSIGENSVIGAGSVVAGSKIPANEVWGGNPARFIKSIPSF